MKCKGRFFGLWLVLGMVLVPLVAQGKPPKKKQLDNRVLDFDVTRDGSRVVYLTKQGQLRSVVVLTNRVEKLGEHKGMYLSRWAPDQFNIALAGPKALKVFHSGNKNSFQVSKLRSRLGDLYWTPTGKELLFEYSDSNRTYYVKARPKSKIYPLREWLRLPDEIEYTTLSVNILTKKPSLSTSVDPFSAHEARYSPDRKRVVFAFQGMLLLTPVKGLKHKVLWKYGASSPRWTPDGKSLVFQKREAQDKLKGLVKINVDKVLKAQAIPVRRPPVRRPPAPRPEEASEPEAREKPKARKRRRRRRRKRLSKAEIARKKAEAEKKKKEAEARAKAKAEAEKKAKAKAKEEAVRRAIQPPPHKLICSFGQNPVISSNGKHLLFYESYVSRQGLYLVPITGGKPRRIYNKAVLRYKFSRGGQRIVFLTADHRLFETESL